MDRITNFLAQADAAAQPSILQTMGPFALMFLAMYFLIIAPQRKKQKKHQKMITELKSGTDVLTSAGIFGTITNVKDDRFILRIADNTKIEISKSSIGSVIASADSE